MVLAEQERRRRQEEEHLKFLQTERERIEQEAAARLAERDAAYRAKGVEPGPWAWFWVLPDLTQAILLGVTFAIPAG
jgi:hypothetical protein